MKTTSTKIKITSILFLIILSCFFITSCKMANENRIVKFETNQGIIKIEMFEQRAPITTKNFIDLVESGFYDKTKFHRIISNFMIQGGDPLSKNDSKKNLWGTGGPGYKIKDEFHPELKNDIGTLSMANAGANTGGSQFFINLVNNNYLDNKHAVFGKVVEGMDIVDKIGKTKTNSRDQPLEAIIILKATVE